jgi:hypothetical protein
MQKIKSFNKVILVMVVALTLLAPVFLTSKTYAVGCSGNGCNGTNPATTGCSANGYLVRRSNFYYLGTRTAVSGVFLDLYYSRTCGTNWIRVTSNPWGGIANKVIQVSKYGSRPYVENDFTYSASYSMQVYAPGTTTVGYHANLYDTAGRLRAGTDDLSAS